VLAAPAIFIIVVQGPLEFELFRHPLRCHHRLSRACQTWCCNAFNPMLRLEPGYARGVAGIEHRPKLAGLLYFTGGLQNPFSFMACAWPDLVDGAPIQLTLALGPQQSRIRLLAGLLPYAAAMGGRGALLVLPQSNLFRFCSRSWWRLASPSVTHRIPRGGPQNCPDALAATELVLTREQHLTQLDGLSGCRRGARTRNSAFASFPDFARTGAER